MGRYTHNGILFSHKKEWNLAICDNVDVPWGHYANWNKSDIEKQILYSLTYMWNLKNKTKTKLINTENRLIARVGVQGEMGERRQKVQTSSYEINKSWECNV